VKSFGICQQKATQIDCILFSRAAKNFGLQFAWAEMSLPNWAYKFCRAKLKIGLQFREQKQLKLTVVELVKRSYSNVVCLQLSKKFRNLAKKQLQLTGN
jgi:hypothetical protein